MKRIVPLLLLLLLLSGCASSQEDSFIEITVPEGGGYAAAVTPVPATPIPTSASAAEPAVSASSAQPAEAQMAAQTAAPSAAQTAKPTATPTAKPTAAPTPAPTAAPTATQSAAPTATPAAAPVSGGSSSDYNSGILELVNEARKQNGLNSLNYCKKLQAAADVRAKEIATLFDHTRPNGMLCNTAISESGVSFTRFGENIFMCTGTTNPTPKAVFDAWMASSGHKENILRDGFTDMCIGVYTTGDSTYVAQLFGAGIS